MNASLQLVIPVYNEQETLFGNMTKLARTLDEDGVAFVAVIVDDGSEDGTWEEIARLRSTDRRFRGLRFSRNFGKEAAIGAGLRDGTAERYLVMDSDLQHPPACIKDMIAQMERSGADLIDGIKRRRGTENPFYKLAAKLYYGLFQRLTGFHLEQSSDFKLMDRAVVEAINALPENRLFFRGLISWIGFRAEPHYFDVAEREGSTGRFTFRQLASFALQSTVSYTSKPLFFIMALGGLFLLFSLILGIQTLVRYFTDRAVDGFTTVIMLQLLIGSILMLSIGVLGLYLARVFDEVKRRPPYIVAETLAGDPPPAADAMCHEG